MIQTEPIVLEQGILNKRWTESRWYALYTRSRCEKQVDRELQKKGLKSFLPLRRVTKHWSDRKVVLEEPLFKGYLFVQIPLSQRWDVLGTAGAVRLIGRSALGPTEVAERDVEAVRRLTESEIQADPFPYLKEGQRVYIRSGPLKGAEGFIVHKDKHCRLVLSLDLLMQSVSVQVDEACIEPL